MEETIRTGVCRFGWQFPKHIAGKILAILLGTVLLASQYFPGTSEEIQDGQQVSRVEDGNIIGGKLSAGNPNGKTGMLEDLVLKNILLEKVSSSEMILAENAVPDKTLVLPDVSDGNLWEAVQQEISTEAERDGAGASEQNTLENAVPDQVVSFDQIGTEEDIFNQDVLEKPLENVPAVNPVLSEKPSGDETVVNPAAPENPSGAGIIADSMASENPSKGGMTADPIVSDIPSGSEMAADPSESESPSGGGAAVNPMVPDNFSGGEAAVGPVKSEKPSGIGAAADPVESGNPFGGGAAVDPADSEKPSGGGATTDPAETGNPSGGAAVIDPAESGNPLGSGAVVDPVESEKTSGGEAVVDPADSENPSDGEGAADPTAPDPEENSGEQGPIPGFCLDETGMLCNFFPEDAEILDGCLTLPEECTGIRRGAFSGCGAEILELYIPTGTVAIEEGALTDLGYLEWIEVEGGNCAYTSDEGVLFDSTRSVLLAFPSGWLDLYVVPPYVTRIANRAFEGTKIYKLDLRKCADLSFGDNVFGGTGGSGIEIAVRDSEMDLYKEKLAGYAVTFTK